MEGQTQAMIRHLLPQLRICIFAAFVGWLVYATSFTASPSLLFVLSATLGVLFSQLEIIRDKRERKIVQGMQEAMGLLPRRCPHTWTYDKHPGVFLRCMSHEGHDEQHWSQSPWSNG
jgi:hypothetical protein